MKILSLRVRSGDSGTTESAPAGERVTLLMRGSTGGDSALLTEGGRGFRVLGRGEESPSEAAIVGKRDAWDECFPKKTDGRREWDVTFAGCQLWYA